MMIRLMAFVPSVSPASAVRCCMCHRGISSANMCQQQAIPFLHGRPLPSLAPVSHAKNSRTFNLRAIVASSGIPRSHTKASTHRKNRSAGQKEQQASTVQPHPPPAPNFIDDAAEIIGGTLICHIDYLLRWYDVLGICEHSAVMHACMHALD